MQFESRTRRMYWTMAALELLPDAALVGALCWYMEWGLRGFVLSFAGLYVFGFILWLKNTIWAWLTFAFWGRQHLAGVLQDGLAADCYPEPSRYQRSAREYFDDLVADDTQTPELRIKAAALSTFFGLAYVEGRMQQAMRFSMAMEDALERHRARFVTGAEAGEQRGAAGQGS